MVCVGSTFTVVPSEPTPTGIFPLSDFNHFRFFSHALPFCLQTPFQRASIPPVFHSHSHQIPKPNPGSILSLRRSAT
ncbi:hypothetical protein QN277_020905 [Acacia crassicarpa]|uniref:Uncharacterized protein n=1 Tax=Acacia crassicarpa TaxID=499986 RepID=A0AAE1MPY3_9FABA|nr:hypothetical protein QN277_020905 [Acacia crassicarpa]